MKMHFHMTGLFQIIFPHDEELEFRAKWDATLKEADITPILVREEEDGPMKKLEVVVALRDVPILAGLLRQRDILLTAVT
jgi:hypothetical protein